MTAPLHNRAGLGVIVVLLWRRQSPRDYGLVSRNLVSSVALSVAAFIPSLVFLLLAGARDGYFPFQRVTVMDEWIRFGLPASVFGIGFIALVWGCFEAFNYVVIIEKVSVLWPPRHFWLDWDAISCGVLAVLTHGLLGPSVVALLESIVVFFAIYGMLLARKFTGNAWGAVAVFALLWNSV